MQRYAGHRQPSLAAFLPMALAVVVAHVASIRKPIYYLAIAGARAPLTRVPVTRHDATGTRVNFAGCFICMCAFFLLIIDTIILR